MWRLLLTALLVCSAILTVPGPARSAEVADAHLADLAAMPVPPSGLPEDGFQLAQAGYLTVDDARYLISESFDLDIDVVAEAIDAGGWQQGYLQHLVLLEDRSYRTSTPLASVETTVLAFADDAGAEAMVALLSAAQPDNSEPHDPVIDGGTTWRVVTSADDRLVTVARSGALVFEIVLADATGTPDSVAHALVVEATLDRAERVAGNDAYGLSHQIVHLADERLVPIAILPESPLVHDSYRLLDGEVIPVAGELPDPGASDVPDGAEQVAVSRQTAELASQTWLAAGVVVVAFGDEASATAFAEHGVLRDPLDLFAIDEDASLAAGDGPVRLEALSGASSTGARYSGYRLTVQDGSHVAQLTVRVIGQARLDQQGAMRWAQAQVACLGDGDCAEIALDTLLASPDPATPAAADVENGVYRSPVAPWSVSFDSADWQVEDTVAEGGYDYLYLRSERMDASFETVVDHQGDPEQCVLHELERLREVEAHANITVGSDDPDEQPGGLSTDHGWVIYTVEPLEADRSSEEYTLRIDCYVVVEGSTSLVVQVRAPRDAWTGLAPNGEALRAGIEIEPASAG